MARDSRFSIDKVRVSVAPSLNDETNTLRYVPTAQWMGCVSLDATDGTIISRDESGKDLPLSQPLPAASLFDIDLRVLDRDQRHDVGIALQNGTETPAFVGPRLRFRPSELLETAVQVRQTSPQDKGPLWLRSIQVVEPTPHDENADPKAV